MLDEHWIKQFEGQHYETRARRSSVLEFEALTLALGVPGPCRSQRAAGTLPQTTREVGVAAGTGQVPQPG